MIKRVPVLLAVVCTLSVQAQEVPATVALLGVFHFANPRLDSVQTDVIDVMRPEHQEYLVDLTDRLSQFKPTVILVEVGPEQEAEVNEDYQEFLDGNLKLVAHEVHQLAFRIAKASNIQTLYGFDDRAIGWDPGRLLDFMEESVPDAWQDFNDQLSRLTDEAAKAHQELSLRELLIMANDPEQDRINKDAYLLTNAVGAGSNFLGADATARWWHRNFRMYANVQKYAQPGQRVLVIAGAGHTAILRDLLAIDRRLIAEDVMPYL